MEDQAGMRAIGEAVDFGGCPFSRDVAWQSRLFFQVLETDVDCGI
jgi:hypothetical protein